MRRRAAHVVESGTPIRVAKPTRVLTFSAHRPGQREVLDAVEKKFGHALEVRHGNPFAIERARLGLRLRQVYAALPDRHSLRRLVGKAIDEQLDLPERRAPSTATQQPC